MLSVFCDKCLIDCVCCGDLLSQEPNCSVAEWCSHKQLSWCGAMQQLPAQTHLWSTWTQVCLRLYKLHLTELCQRCGDSRLRSSSRGDFLVPRTSLRL